MKSSMVYYKRLLVSGIILAFSLTGCQNSEPLFNGRDLNGWVAVDGTLEEWTMENGVLKTSDQGEGWIRTVSEYSDF